MVVFRRNHGLAGARRRTVKKKEKKTWSNPLAHVRLPLPMQTGGAHGPKKGKKQYNRNRAKEELHREMA